VLDGELDVTTIALAQMDVQIGRPEANLDRARDFAAQAQAEGADLVLLPELWLHGYDLEQAETWAVPLGEGGFLGMAEMARRFHLHVAGTLLERHAGGISNTAVLYAPDGGLLAAYRKVHLFRLMQEDQYLVPGDHAVLCPTPWGATGLSICYDLRFPEFFRALALAGVTLFLVSAQWPVPRLEAWLILARARAVENEVFVAACNRVGRQGTTVFPGRSCVVGPLGRVLVEGDGQERLLVARINPHQVKAARRYLPVYEDRRPKAYRVERASQRESE